MALVDDAVAEVHQLAEVEDLVERVKRANDLAARLQEIVGELGQLRREAVLELASEGHSPAQLARLLDMTRVRVHQLLSSGPKAERALLGKGSLTVSIGGKWEGQKANPSAVISAEALAAYNTICELAEEYNLSASYEIVPPPGLVRLNKENLIVIGSPRILPIVGQSLEADRHLGFDSDAQGRWFLRDHDAGEVHRSPSDTGEPEDYAYIGRLPRPDGRGTFLYLAGIHAMGTIGAATYLADHVDELYGKVKTKRWSILVRCRYDPDTRKIEETGELTPLKVDT
jgi:hypothetical protein